MFLRPVESVTSNVFFTHLRRACILSITKRTQISRLRVRTALIPRIRIASTVGKNYFRKGFTWLTIAITAWNAELLAITTYLDPRGPGSGAAKRRPPRSAGKWLKQRQVDQSRCGETVSKRARFSMLTSVWMVRSG